MFKSIDHLVKWKSIHDSFGVIELLLSADQLVLFLVIESEFLNIRFWIFLNLVNVMIVIVIAIGNMLNVHYFLP